MRYDLEPPPSSGRDIVETRLLAGLTLEELAELTGRHRTTWRRAELGTTRPCLGCYRLLGVLAGRIPWPGWRGWSAGRDGRLYDAGGMPGGPEELRRAWWLEQLVGELEREIERLRFRVRALEARMACQARALAHDRGLTPRERPRFRDSARASAVCAAASSSADAP